jgi:hypothetical protein
MEPGQSPTVQVTWTKDRQRYRRALVELPVLRRMRRFVGIGVVVSLACFVLLALVGASFAWFVLAAMPALLPATVYLSSIRTMLREVGAGALSWTFDGQGLRIVGTTTTEIPWAQMVRWYRRAGHLMLEVRRPNERTPHQGCAAPLTAFDEAAWPETVALLHGHLGDEDAALRQVDESGATTRPSGG